MPPVDQNGKINSASRLRSQQHAERIQSRKNNPYQKMRNDQVKGSAEDKFDLSPQSSEVSSIKERVHQLPDADMEKVEQLRRLIQNGNYEIDSQKMADSILAASVSLADHE